MLNFLQKKKNNRPLIAHYRPPDNMPAAEIGYLIDNKIGRLELIATIYQLKIKKYISLFQDGNDGVLITLTVYAPDKLSAYEDLLMRYLFHESRSIHLQALLARYDFVVFEGYFNYLTLQTLINKNLIVSNNRLHMLTYEDYLTTVGQNLFIFMSEFFKSIKGVKLTARGHEQLYNLEGFKLYIETAEVDKIKFHIKNDLKGYIESMTPYAIVFKQTQRWETLEVPTIYLIKNSGGTEQKSQGTALASGSLKEMGKLAKKINCYSIVGDAD
jgi:Predicted membrane protein (DUF2207)